MGTFLIALVVVTFVDVSYLLSFILSLPVDFNFSLLPPAPQKPFRKAPNRGTTNRGCELRLLSSTTLQFLDLTSPGFLIYKMEVMMEPTFKFMERNK